MYFIYYLYSCLCTNNIIYISDIVFCDSLDLSLLTNNVNEIAVDEIPVDDILVNEVSVNEAPINKISVLRRCCSSCLENEEKTVWISHGKCCPQCGTPVD